MNVAVARRAVPWRVLAVLAVIAASAAYVASVWRPGGSAERVLPLGPAPPCPERFVDSLGRGERLRAALRTTVEGARLLEALGPSEARYCFGEVEVPVVMDQRVLLLDAGTPDAELAARTGHLLHHVLHGSPFPATIAADTDCRRVVRDALRAEAPAYAVELRLRRALSVAERRYAFEPAFYAADDGERVILEYLLAHPEGGPGLDPLGSAYLQRCEVARAEAERR